MDFKFSHRALPLATATALLTTTAAWADDGPIDVGGPPGTPGPLIGAGVPALVGLGLVYRRFRHRRIRRSQKMPDKD